MIDRLRILLFLALLLCGAGRASAQQAVPAAPAGAPVASPTGLTPAEAQRAIDVLQDPRKRSELIETLRAIGKAMPPPAAAASPEPAAPAAKPAAPPAPVSLAPGSLGAQLLWQASHWPKRLAHEAAVTSQTFVSFPLLWDWGQNIAADPDKRKAVLDAIWRATLVVGCSLLIGWLARLGLRRPVNALATHAPNGLHPNGSPPNGSHIHPAADNALPSHRASAWHLLRRLPFALVRLVLELVPVAVFWGAATLLAASVPTELTRAAIEIVVEAYATARIVMSVGRMLVSPAMGRLRLLQIGDAQAGFLIEWLRRITLVAVCGSALADLALLFGLYEDAYDTLIRVIALIVAVLIGMLVLRCRETVAARLRPLPGAEGGLARWRNWLAATWHLLGLIAIAAGWILFAAGIQEGLGGLRVLIGTILILVAARLAAIVVLGMLDRAVRLGQVAEAQRAPGTVIRAARYQGVARVVVTAVIVVATGVVLLEFWGLSALMWFEPGRVGARLVSAVVTIGVAALASVIVWEGSNSALEHRLARLSEAGPATHSARLRTLLPILRAALLTAILAVVGLTALSQIGVDIAPLLAGAGIVGVAVGFGSQKLVQDVITGMFVLLENAIQVGDWVTVAGLSGAVERLSVRNIWLRGDDGAVHIIPFSAVTSITNNNRGFGNATVSVTVPYTEDSDRIAGVLSDIVAEMRRDAKFSGMMLGDLKVWVDAVKSVGVTLAGQIACTDAGRWPIQHEFNRRLQKRFRELGIELGAG